MAQPRIPAVPRHRRPLPAEAALFEPLENRQLLSADLVPFSLMAPQQSIEAGDDFSATVSFRNDGDAAAAPFRVEVHLSRDSMFGNDDDLVINSFLRPDGLAQGGSSTITRSFVVPAGTLSGSYFIGFWVDSGNAIPEFNELNNTFLSITTAINIFPDNGRLEVRGINNAIIADGDTTPSTGDGTGFGLARIDGQSRTREFNIINHGANELRITDVRISGERADAFQIIDRPADRIGGGESERILIRFDPSFVGFSAATLTITSTDSNNGVFQFTIRGRGLPPLGIPHIGATGFIVINDGDASASPADGTDFGIARPGRTLQRTFTVTNIGGGQLILTTPFVRLAGRNPRRFAVVSTSSQALNPGASTTFTIRYSSTAIGASTARLEIASNDPGTGVFDFQVRATVRPTV